jgi:hypothetical protein
MTKKRMSFLKELLPFMGLGGRLRLEWISSAEAQKFVKVVTEFTEQIRNLGPNPLAKNYGDSLESLELAPTPSEATGCGCGCSKAAAGA